MKRCPRWLVLCAAIGGPGVPAFSASGGGALPDNDVVMNAVVAELDRSMKELALDDLPRPYLIQYRVVDRLGFNIMASYGGLVRDSAQRGRFFASRVRVGSYELDNTNFRGSYGGGGALPIDDNYAALRQAVWGATDADYKRAIEALTAKQAKLKYTTIEDRPDDYTGAEPVRLIEPSAKIAFDQDRWKRNIKRLSAEFKKFPRIKDGWVEFDAGAENRFIINSEGTRLRTGDTGVSITIYVEIQAAEGMELGDQLNYLAQTIDKLPTMDQMLSDIGALCRRLADLADAPVLEHYVGPVLFEPVAAGKVFQGMLAQKLRALPTPVGQGRAWADQSLEKRIGTRILPRSFQIYDDPTAATFGDTALTGAYRFDDEAVPARRVVLVKDGKLVTLVSGRAPTKKIKTSTGHARTGGAGDPMAIPGCLYISDDNGMSAAELKQELIEAAKGEGLEFALRIADLESGYGSELGDPIYVYKVYVEDGREELVRGVEFLPVELRSLKRLLAAGNRQEVYNAMYPPISVIAPAILFEELELTKIEQEFDKLPILDSPAQRDKSDNP